MTVANKQDDDANEKKKQKIDEILEALRGRKCSICNHPQSDHYHYLWNVKGCASTDEKQCDCPGFLE